MVMTPVPIVVGIMMPPVLVPMLIPVFIPSFIPAFIRELAMKARGLQAVLSVSHRVFSEGLIAKD
jgi:hypothetical protein